MRYFLVRDKASNGTSDNKNIQHTPFPREYNNFFSFRFVGFLPTLVHYNGLDISCLVAVDMEVGRSFGEYIRVRLNDFCDLDGQASQVMFESHGRERERTFPMATVFPIIESQHRVVDTIRLKPRTFIA